MEIIVIGSTMFPYMTGVALSSLTEHVNGDHTPFSDHAPFHHFIREYV